MVLVSFDPRDTPRRRRSRRSGRTSQYWTARADLGRLALPHRRRSHDQPRHRRPPASTTSSTPATGQFAHVSGVLVATPRRHAWRGTSTASSTRRRNCGWRWSNRARATSARPSTSCCSSVTTTIPETGRYGVIVMNLVRVGGVLTLGADGELLPAHAPPPRAHAAGGSAPSGTLNIAVWIPAIPRTGVHHCARGGQPVFLHPRRHGLLRPARRGAGPLLRDQVPRRHRAEGRRADYRLDPARNRLVDRAVLRRNGDLRLGDDRVLPDRAAAGPDARDLLDRQALDVALPAPRRCSARSTSCTCRSVAR